MNGTTDRLDFASVATLTASPITVACWVFLDAAAHATYLFCAHAAADATFGLLFGVNTSRQAQMIREWSGTDAASLTSSSAIALSAWTHLAATHDGSANGSAMTFYTAGASVAATGPTTGTGSEVAPSGTWTLGGRVFDDARNLDGRLAEVGVWNRVLSAAEIAALAKGYSPRHFPSGLLFAPPLLGYAAEIDPVSGKTATHDGTTKIDHPRVIYPKGHG